MKWIPRFFLLLFAISFQQCEDTCVTENTYVYLKPVYSTSAEIKAAVGFDAPQDIHQAGKIYFYENYLFINEIGEGIHLIDNRIPASPKPLGFLTIPGNLDLVIQNDLLYADSYIDLVVFDISNLSLIKEVNRIERLFEAYNSFGFYSDPLKGVVTDWEKVENVTVQRGTCNSQIQSWGGIYIDDGIGLTAGAFSNFKTMGGSAQTATQGIGGSMARFTLAGNYLYALDGSNMEILNLANGKSPEVKKEIEISWDVETLFPHEEKLFMGARSGMYIYDLEVPESPKLLSQYAHVQSCDPVVVEGDYAYVTLRNGNTCQGFVNQLEVINIKDVKAPMLVNTYAMTNPHGLAIDNGLLFICDGTDGLKVFDAKDVKTISEHQLVNYKEINALDVIAFNNVAMMISSDGLYQYDYSDIKNIKFLSKLAIIKL
ncbi:MAG: hypothetical protein JJE09_04835 [Bacteroidia bacterium]|nr:hypothetical protein [Bacteroidia bacterium]